MQTTQLGTLIEKFASVMRTSGGEQAAVGMERIANAISRGGTQAFSKFVVAINKAGSEAEAGDGCALGSLVSPMVKLVALLNDAGAKKSVVSDLELLVDVVQRRREMSLSSFESLCQRAVASASRGKGKPGAPPVDTRQLIESYLQRLEASLGNDAVFRSLNRELAADKHVGRTEAVEIASRFMETLAPSTSRPKALQKILYRHEKLLESRAASSTIGGKAA